MSAEGILRKGEGGLLLFWCPGCDGAHGVPTGEGTGPRWTFNGDFTKPTFTPSIRVQGHQFVKGTDESRAFVCHSIVSVGEIYFCTDSTHALAGQTVALPAFDEGMGP